jgi:hypothetical protein
MFPFQDSFPFAYALNSFPHAHGLGTQHLLHVHELLPLVKALLHYIFMHTAMSIISLFISRFSCFDFVFEGFLFQLKSNFLSNDDCFLKKTLLPYIKSRAHFNPVPYFESLFCTFSMFLLLENTS